MPDDAILLAGGLASRLNPVTAVTNKHLLPVYDKPMLFHGLELLAHVGVKNIVIILGGNSVGDIVNLVKGGEDFGLNVTYKYQTEPKGISHAISLARNEIRGNNFLVLLGDNVFDNHEHIKNLVEGWDATAKDDGWVDYTINPMILLYSVKDASQYGQPIFDGEGHIIDFVEKQKNVGHNLAIPGLYGLPYYAFNIIREQEPSARGELEITDTLKAFLPEIYWVEYQGHWTDCGTPKGLAEASMYFALKNGS